MPRGKYTLKPKAMRRIRDQIERNRIRTALREDRIKRQKEKQRKEEVSICSSIDRTVNVAQFR